MKFQSPHDGTEMLLSPEHSMEIQNSIGADVMMQLDDVVASTTTGPRVEQAMWRSVRWLDRSDTCGGEDLHHLPSPSLPPSLSPACICL